MIIMKKEKELALKKLHSAVCSDCFVAVFCMLWEVLGIFFGIVSAGSSSVGGMDFVTHSSSCV